MAKPKSMVPKDDAQKMDAPQEQSEQQDLEQNDEATEAAEEVEQAAAESKPSEKKKSGKTAKKHRALVNMHIPGGTVLVQGQEHELTKADHAHLDKHFPNSKHHIISE